MKRVIMAVVVVLGLASTANAGPVYSGVKAAGKGIIAVAKYADRCPVVHGPRKGAAAAGRYIGRIARVL